MTESLLFRSPRQELCAASQEARQAGQQEERATALLSSLGDCVSRAEAAAESARAASSLSDAACSSTSRNPAPSSSASGDEGAEHQQRQPQQQALSKRAQLLALPLPDLQELAGASAPRRAKGATDDEHRQRLADAILRPAGRGGKGGGGGRR